MSLGSDQGLGPPPVHVLPHLLGHRVVEILVDAGARVIPDQSEPTKGAAIHDPDGEGRAVHLLLGQLHVQELDILTEVRILVGVLYDCALNIKEALYSAQEGRKQKLRKKRLNGSFYCFTANIFNKFPTNLNYVTSAFHVNSRLIHCQKLHPFQISQAPE